MQTLKQVLNNRQPNAIAPFLWLHGETEEVMRTEVQRIHNCGIGAICVEARPHQDFNGPGWFRDLAILLEECKKNGMELWILDDSHFPTGFADGQVKKKYPDKCKKFLCCKTYDFAGPQKHSGAVLKYALRDEKDRIIGVYLSRKTGFEEIDPATTIDLSDYVEWNDDFNTGKPKRDHRGNELSGREGKCPIVRFDLSEGEWSLCVLTVSYKGGEEKTEGYLNPIDPEATQILLDVVYQPIYEHFGEEFGKTIRGFFSDEPRFGNIHGAEVASIGRNSAMNLPWRDDLKAMLEQELKGTVLEGKSVVALLPLLFIDGAGRKATRDAHTLRYAYMQMVSRLYSENFDGVIGRWCQAHGVEHIGHTIEDNNAHSRLGHGAGHFYRAMAFQDMAGIDVVLHQLTPGQDKGLFKGMHSPAWDGEFYTYVLGKLGGSLAHLDSKKKGRCMCELFGAYGWSEGNRLCKWLADYMLVRGVNYFVPHAFDPAPFPDMDCPPHFYAHGHNPQYPEFGELMMYMQRMASMLQGLHKAPVALLYHAEAEWSGDYMETQKPAAVLARSCIDYDIVPAEYLTGDSVRQEHLIVNHEHFAALVIPFSEALPAALLESVVGYIRANLPVYFVGGLPVRTSEGTPMPNLEGARAVTLQKLAAELAHDGIPELSLTTDAPYLRYYHTRQTDGDVYFFVNEGLTPLHTCVQGAKVGRTYVYDAFANTVAEDNNAFVLKLPPYTAKCVLVPDDPKTIQAKKQTRFVVRERISLTRPQATFAFAINCCQSYVDAIKLKEWKPVDELPGMACFAGRIRYELTQEFTASQAACPARLILDGVQEGACVTVNGKECGVRICSPYIFDLTERLTEGDNNIVIEVNTTLGRSMNDYLCQYLPMEPLGITGGAVIELGEEE